MLDVKLNRRYTGERMLRARARAHHRKVIGVGTLLVFVGLLMVLFGPKQTRIIAPIGEDTGGNSSQKSQPTGSLQAVVQGALTGTTATYAVVVRHLVTGEQYELNSNEVFDSGSLYKLWVMASAYDQIQKGKLAETDTLTSSIAALNTTFNIASEEAELTEGGITMTVQQALTQMITISHNYAALLLSARLKLSTIRSYLTAQGFTQSTLGEPPQTTAAETAKFIEALYRGELADTASTNKMMELLKRQTLNHKLPKLLPAGVLVAHKTGEIGGFSHDAGIVSCPTGDYLIVVMSESDNPEAAEERIAKVSAAVYEYFAKKK